MSSEQTTRGGKGGKLTAILLLVVLVAGASLFFLVPHLKHQEMKRKDAEGLLLLDQQAYEEAINFYRYIGDYAPVRERIEAAKAGIRERDYQKGETAFKAGRMAEAEDLYLSVHPYQQTAERLEVIKAWKLAYAKKLTPFSDSNGKYGYKDPNGATVLPAVYLSAGHFSDGYAPVTIKQKGPEPSYTFDDKICIYIDATGKEVFDQRFAIAGEFRHGYAIVGMGEYARSSSDQCGIIDSSGQFVLQPLYQDLRWINDSELIAQSKGLYGVINLRGEALLEPTFHKFEPFYDGMAAVKFDEKWGYVSAEDYRIVVKPQFSSAHGFFHGVAMVFAGNESGLIDTKGNYVIPMQEGRLSALSEQHSETMQQRYGFFHDALPPAESALLFVLKEKVDSSDKNSNLLYTVYDAAGNIIIPAEQEVDDSYRYYPEVMGSYICMTTGTSSFYSSSRNTLMRTLYTMEGKQYASANWIEHLPVNGEDWFLLKDDAVNALLTPAGYDIRLAGAKEYRVMSANCIAVSVDGKWGLVDAQGKLLAGYQWDQIDAPSEGIMKAKLQEKWGYLAETGEIISKAVWDDAADFHEGRAVVRQRALYD